MIAIDSRKCRATSHGLRSVSTVMPPSTACAGMPSERSAAPAGASPALAPGRDQRERAATAPTHEGQLAVGELDDPVDRVLPGRASSEAVVHDGQVGQPSPESVSRTAPPVTTMSDVGDDRGERQPAQRSR